MIVVLGLSHKTAPIEVRERAALSPEAVSEVLSELVAQASVGEALIVSTCNRVEIVAAARSTDPEQLPMVANEVQRVLVGRVPSIENHLYKHVGPDAIRHLFRVASSLDSLVLGEPQILGQVKQAFEIARQDGTVGTHLNRVISHALRTAKRVRNETAVGAGQVSVPSVAIDLARQIFGDLKGRKAALIGSGQMGESVAKLLTQAGAELVVLARNPERRAALAEQLAAEPRGFEELSLTLAEADVIVTTTSAPGFVVDKDAVAAVRRQRRGRSLFFIDLAVPRDVDPKVDEIDNTFLYNVDDLSQIVAETLTSRQKEAERAEHIVAGEANSYERSLFAEQITPTILALRKHFSASLEAELDKTMRSRLKHLGDAEREALDKMLDSALNKLLHPATKHLRTLAADEDSQTELDQSIAMLTELFNLEVTSEPNASASPKARGREASTKKQPSASESDDEDGEQKVS